MITRDVVISTYPAVLAEQFTIDLRVWLVVMLSGRDSEYLDSREEWLGLFFGMEGGAFYLTSLYSINPKGRLTVLSLN